VGVTPDTIGPAGVAQAANNKASAASAKCKRLIFNVSFMIFETRGRMK
jgi:hypothetical protein